jgi:hypothetical protein
MNNGCRISQLGAVLRLAVPGPMPMLLEFTGESLLALLMAAQAAFRERRKSEHHAKGGRNSAMKRRVV